MQRFLEEAECTPLPPFINPCPSNDTTPSNIFEMEQSPVKVPDEFTPALREKQWEKEIQTNQSNRIVPTVPSRTALYELTDGPAQHLGTCVFPSTPSATVAPNHSSAMPTPPVNTVLRVAHQPIMYQTPQTHTQQTPQTQVQQQVPQQYVQLRHPIPIRPCDPYHQPALTQIYAAPQIPYHIFPMQHQPMQQQQQQATCEPISQQTRKHQAHSRDDSRSEDNTVRPLWERRFGDAELEIQVPVSDRTRCKSTPPAPSQNRTWQRSPQNAERQERSPNTISGEVSAAKVSS